MPLHSWIEWFVNPHVNHVTMTTLTVQIIPTFLWGQPGKVFLPKYFTNRLARPDIRLRFCRDLEFDRGGSNYSPTLHKIDHGVFNIHELILVDRTPNLTSSRGTTTRIASMPCLWSSNEIVSHWDDNQTPSPHHWKASTLRLHDQVRLICMHT